MKFRKSMNCKISLEKKMPIDLTRPDIFRKIDLHGSSNQFKPQLRSKSSVDFYKKATTDGVFYSGRSRSSLSLQLRISKSLSSSDHYGCFWKFLSKKYLRKITILFTKEYKIRKNEATFVMSILKLVIL